MKKIYTAANPMVAHMVRGVLETHGFKSIVKGEDLFSVRGELPMVGDTFPTVWLIGNVDFEKATSIVDEFDRNMNRSDADAHLNRWRCEKCGEYHEEQFTSCWKCGAHRPHN